MRKYYCGLLVLKLNYYIEVLKKYIAFSGRARRAEYWYFALFNSIISVLLIVIDQLIGTHGQNSTMGVLSGLYSLAVLLPSLGVLVRRLHDTGRSGWWWLIAFIPLIGAIILIVFTVSDSTPGDNKYGPNPKGVGGNTGATGAIV